MKKSFLAFAAVSVLSLTACGGMAHATEYEVNATGTVVYGTGQALSVEKDTASGNRVAIKYSSGVQYATDDANWTMYGKLVAALGARGVAVPNSPTGKVYNVALVGGLYCISSQSVVAWPNVGQPDYLSDGCAFWQTVKALAQ